MIPLDFIVDFFVGYALGYFLGFGLYQVCVLCYEALNE
jgi:hypothetical protein